MKIMLKYCILALLAFTILLFSFVNYENPHLESILRLFNSYIENRHFYKVYLHLDKTQYHTGEYIWIKAYVFDSKANKLDTISSNLFVEFINNQEKVIYRQLLNIESGTAHGQLFLPDSLFQGTYQLRAYTDYMRNFKSNYFFTTYIRVINEKNKFISFEYYKKIKRLLKKRNRSDISFFPEGGELIVGIKTKVAFKTTDQFGKPNTIKGYLIDDKKNILCKITFQNSGIGYFYIDPLANSNYSVIIDSDGHKQKYNLPEVKESGYSLCVEDDEYNLVINCRASIKEIGRGLDKGFIIINDESQVIYVKEFSFYQNNYKLTIPKNELSNGIVNITLFDYYGVLKSERLYFNYHRPNRYFEVKTLKTSYNHGETIEMEIYPPEGTTESFDLSLSVTNKPPIDTVENIINELFINSYLINKIKKPSYISNNHEAIDLIMLTNKWGKYRWEEISTGKIPELTYGIENKICIKGKLQKPYLNILAKNVLVKLTILNHYNDIYKTVTDQKGEFHFDGLNIKDSIELLFETAFEQKDNFLFEIYQKDTPVIQFDHFNYVETWMFSKENIKKVKKKSASYENIGSSHVNYVITEDKIRANLNTNVKTIILSNVPGIHLSNGILTFSELQNNPYSAPMLIIDGSSTTIDLIESLPPESIERIEIIKPGIASSIYGINSGNGVIIIYRKKESNYKKGQFYLKTIGYQTPKKFYQVQLSNESSIIEDNSKINTIFWEPNLLFQNGKSAKIKFKHVLGNNGYYIILEGISDKGDMIHQVYHIKI